MVSIGSSISTINDLSAEKSDPLSQTRTDHCALANSTTTTRRNIQWKTTENKRKIASALRTIIVSSVQTTTVVNQPVLAPGAVYILACSRYDFTQCFTEHCTENSQPVTAGPRWWCVETNLILHSNLQVKNNYTAKERECDIFGWEFFLYSLQSVDRALLLSVCLGIWCCIYQLH